MKGQKLFWIACLTGALCALGCGDDSSTISGVVMSNCGNGIIDEGEACDDGNTVSGDGCSASCVLEDGFECKTEGEPCEKIDGKDNDKQDEDDGKDEPHNDPVCGNGVVESGEICDDKNTEDGDGCSSDCKTIEAGYDCSNPGEPCVYTKARCGDGILDEGEECDDGEGSFACIDCKVVDGYACIGEIGAQSECKQVECGDEAVDAPFEECDEGDRTAEYGLSPNNERLCTSKCKFAPYCGDGEVFEGINDGTVSIDAEECDLGDDNEDNPYGEGKCSKECKKAPYCGDGIKNGEEVCDPNINGGNPGCGDDCKPKTGYTCNAVDGTCKEKNAIKCGDGNIDGIEECDQTGNGCTNCQHDEGYKCVNSVVSPCSECSKDAGKQCKKISDGYGNGVLDPDGFEECDDGNKKDGDGCSSNGKLEDGFICPEVGKACKPICGDGKIKGNEKCDDGNRKDGDGCKADCSQIEDGYVCQTPGKPCKINVCGDGIVGEYEACDGQAGCGSDCKSVKSGYCYSKAKGLHKCTTKSCGNGILEFGEECDDGNTLGGDGCDNHCKVEYGNECPNGVDCRPICGDGKVMWQLGEKCDLGSDNGKGKGCSLNCQIEPGFTCTDPAKTFPSQINLPVVYRDFVGRNLTGSGSVNDVIYNDLKATDCRRTLLSSEPKDFISQIKGRISDLVAGQAWLKKGYGYPDFEGFAGNLCLGLVKNELGADGKPVFNGSLNDNCCGDLQSCSNFFSGSKAKNGATYVSYNYGSASSPAWHHPSKLNKRHHLLCADSLKKWYQTDSNINREIKTTLGLKQVGGSTSTKYVYDSAKDSVGYFSPIDGKGWNEKNSQNNHNASFTTEISTYFQYKGGETLNFSGDDDVWVFINGQLFLDIGGMHATVEAQNTLSSNTCSSNGKTKKCDTRYDIYENGIYELKVFHAERAASGANFKLTLDGFINPGEVSCNSKCGDGILAANEECEDGKFNGKTCADYKGAGAVGALKCTNCRIDSSACKVPDKPKNCGNGKLDAGEECDVSAGADPKVCNELTCKLQCGDGYVNKAVGEECDLGSQNNNDGSSGCTKACKAPYCGDGIVSAYAGEVCDDGKNTTTYGEGCMPGCTRKAPFCGDGKLQAEHGEECDLGKDKNTGAYGGCTADCKLAIRCGDGIINGGEECDCGSGNVTPSDPKCNGSHNGASYCSNNCTVIVN